ncbi:MAG: hypothetical protein VX589_08560 [Myxococcota bacterium]|nr:hypothetical protein [Myxococcota bacterium]
MSNISPFTGAHKVKKAAPKAGRKRAGRKKISPPPPLTADVMAQHPVLSRLGADVIADLCSRGTYAEYARGDDLLRAAPADDDDAEVLFITFGDVSVHRTQKDLDERISNYAAVGEVFIEKLVCDEDTRLIRVTAMCPVHAVRLPYRIVNELLSAEIAFRDALSDSVRQFLARQKTRFDSSFQQDIARFLVKERLTFAGRVKLKRMDICIECDGCYQACTARHGTNRLGGSEVKYGLTEVPQNCHNCVVPECMDKCKFGHIGRHPETNEIVIDDNCIGCTMCSKGCSFGSIRMHPLSELDLETYFPNRSPDAKGKAIAQKCDNCTGYADKACISACPTGALFQIDGTELFNAWQQFSVHERPGFEAVEPPESVPKKWRRFWVAFTLLNAFALAWECFGRLYWPNLTFTSVFHHLGVLSDGVDPDAPYKPGDFFSHALGYVGAFLMLGTQLYRLRKWKGSTQVWMEVHIWMGVLGGLYALFHTAFFFNDPIAIATFGTMMLAIVTGTIGRYVLYLVPRNQAGTQLRLSEINGRMLQLDEAIENQFSDARTGHTAIIKVAELANADGQQPSDSRLSMPSVRRFWVGIWNMLRQQRRDKRAVVALAGALRSDVREGHNDELTSLMMERAQLERALGHYDVLARIVKHYRVVHVTSSNIMFGALVLHIVFALMYQVN